MDWGFVAVERPGGERARIACFAMVCHHCGGAHVEFFPNARQENLLIGMLHAFSALGVPATVLTDNMKSVVVRRDADVSVNIIFTISTNAFSPIAPTRIRRIRQRGCAAFGA